MIANVINFPVQVNTVRTDKPVLAHTRCGFTARARKPDTREVKRPRRADSNATAATSRQSRMLVYRPFGRDSDPWFSQGRLGRRSGKPPPVYRHLEVPAKAAPVVYRREPMMNHRYRSLLSALRKPGYKHNVHSEQKRAKTFHFAHARTPVNTIT